MHKKFLIKRTINELLNEMEETSKSIENILKTATHLDNYCREHQQIEEIYNFTYITETLKNELFFLNRELNAIVLHDKYNNQDITEIIREKFDYENVEFDD